MLYDVDNHEFVERGDEAAMPCIAQAFDRNSLVRGVSSSPYGDVGLTVPDVDGFVRCSVGARFCGRRRISKGHLGSVAPMKGIPCRHRAEGQARYPDGHGRAMGKTPRSCWLVPRPMAGVGRNVQGGAGQRTVSEGLYHDGGMCLVDYETMIRDITRSHSFITSSDSSPGNGPRE